MIFICFTIVLFPLSPEPAPSKRIRQPLARLSPSPPGFTRPGWAGRDRVVGAGLTQEQNLALPPELLCVIVDLLVDRVALVLLATGRPAVGVGARGATHSNEREGEGGAELLPVGGGDANAALRVGRSGRLPRMKAS